MTLLHLPEAAAQDAPGCVSSKHEDLQCALGVRLLVHIIAMPLPFKSSELQDLSSGLPWV